MKRLPSCSVRCFDLACTLGEKALRGSDVVGCSDAPAAPDALDVRCSFGTRAWSRQRRVETGRSASLARSVLRPTALRCSVLRPVAELTTRTAFASFEQPRRECLRVALRARPQVLRFSAHQKARCGLSPRAFADALLVLAATKTKNTASRQAGPGAGDLWGAEQRSPEGGARSALRKHSRRGCSNGANAVRKVSSATHPPGEQRRAVGACHRPPQCESAPGPACRDAGPIGTTKAIEPRHRSCRCEPELGTVSPEGALAMHWPTNGNKTRPANPCQSIDT